MSQAPILMNRQEAAAYLGVSAQTVSNYVDRGLLHFVGDFPSHQLRRDEVEMLAAVPELKTTIEMQEAVAEMHEVTDKEWRKKKADNLALLMDNNWGGYRYIVDMVAYVIFSHLFITDAITKRERDIAIEVMGGARPSELADKYDLSPARIRQLFYKAIRVARRLDHYIGRELRQAIKEKNELANENRDLRNRIDALLAATEKQREGVERYSDERVQRTLDLDIQDLCFLSVRPINCLKAAEIYTLGDLVRHRRADVWKIRNMGRKSMREIDELLEHFGLEWEMLPPKEV